MAHTGRHSGVHFSTCQLSEWPGDQFLTISRRVLHMGYLSGGDAHCWGPWRTGVDSGGGGGEGGGRRPPHGVGGGRRPHGAAGGRRVRGAGVLPATASTEGVQ